MGQLTEQFIRARSKPFIVEVDQQEKVLTQSAENLFVLRGIFLELIKIKFDLILFLENPNRM